MWFGARMDNSSQLWIDSCVVISAVANDENETLYPTFRTSSIDQIAFFDRRAEHIDDL